jgi:exonuclease III
MPQWINPEPHHALEVPMSQPFRVASFNVNGIRARLPLLLNWLQKEAPEVVCLQETKVQDSEFPREDLEGLGFVDVFRLHLAEGGHYTFWDYRVPNALARRMGWRVDHIWATEPMARRSQRAWIDLEPRKSERPSDHTPILAEFEVD